MLSSDPQSQDPPTLPPPAIEGIDVSYLQGVIDWGVVSQAGVQFVYCKATEGPAYADPAFIGYAASAKDAGFSVGAYHVGRPSIDPERQARHFAAVAKDAINLPPALDLELSLGITGDAYLAWLMKLICATEDLFGRPCVLYTYPWFWEQEVYNLSSKPVDTLTDIARRALWIANYSVKHPIIPKPWINYTLWQYSGDGGHVPGVTRDCDRDRFNGTWDEFEGWANQPNLESNLLNS